MKLEKTQNFLFRGKPNNYAIIDKNISRSAQPQKDDFIWLKEQGVTDIINFRTMVVEKIDFNEAEEVEKLGLKYHNIPTITKNPNEQKIYKFIELVNNIIKNNGKAHIHCKAGADRTGMYAFIYKTLTGIGSQAENEKEWLKYGHNTKLYPNLIDWTKKFLARITKR